MNVFTDRGGILHAEHVPLPAVAEAVGTPVHVYSDSALRDTANAFADALRHCPSTQFAFAVKGLDRGVMVLRCGTGQAAPAERRLAFRPAPAMLRMATDHGGGDGLWRNEINDAA